MGQCEEYLFIGKLRSENERIAGKNGKERESSSVSEGADANGYGDSSQRF